MGWLGWQAEAALATDVNLVIMALDSRGDLINMIFGDGKKRTARKKRKPSAADFKQFVQMNNRTKAQLDG